MKIPSIIEEFKPEIGIVLGSGLGSFADAGALDVNTVIPYSQIDDLPLSTVPGHKGRFLLGKFAGKRFIVAQGRVHLYEGWSAQEVTSGIRLMATSGIRTLILTNAAGVLNTDMRPGEWMALKDHLNLTGTSPLLGGAQFVDMSVVYDSELRHQFLAAAASCDTIMFEGVYAGVRGPQYETPAEIRMLGILGADAVGMSTVIEAIQARALGLRVTGFSCLTNWAAGLSQEPLSHQEVLVRGAAAAGRFVNVLKTALRNGLD
ncbi:MAG: purine-nucleoside phosphorylase [Verrucomicrobia bacterium]|nr:purine-nucleoside phosphorylase [Verrucomicrobiota bacterium]